MRNIEHPSELIDSGLVKTIRSYAREAEQLKQLNPAQLAIIYQQKWFQLFVPKCFGGLELTLPEALQLEEALAWIDGSVGWTVTLCAGAGWFIGFLDPKITAGIFNDAKLCIAGSGNPSGFAKQIKNGYEITGCWDFASGAHAASAFTANCVVEENGSQAKNEDGSPLIRSFLFLRDEVTIHDTWNAVGMIATGSNSFEVKETTLNENRTFLINKSHAVLKDPLYQYPFLQFAETTLAVNSSGMALRFLELCKSLFEGSPRAWMPGVLENAACKLEITRELFYSVANASWAACNADDGIAPVLLTEVSRASKQLATISRKLVDELYPYCGMQAANPSTELNRVWRNLHTACQHSLFNSQQPDH